MLEDLSDEKTRLLILLVILFDFALFYELLPVDAVEFLETAEAFCFIFAVILVFAFPVLGKGQLRHHVGMVLVQLEVDIEYATCVAVEARR